MITARQALLPRSSLAHAPGPRSGRAQSVTPAPLAMVKVEVKWQKEVFRDVEVDTTAPPAVLKSQLFSLTGVPPERQKILGLKGGLLKDDAEWGATGIRDGSKLTMLGSAAAAPQAPTAAPTFLEDLPVEQQDTTGEAQRCRCRHGRQGGGVGGSGTRRALALDAPPLEGSGPLPPQTRARTAQAWQSTVRGWRTWATRAT